VINITDKKFKYLQLTAATVIAATLLSSCAVQQFPVLPDEPRQSKVAIERFRACEYFIKARDYERRGLYETARHLYEMAYGLDPSSPVLRRLLAEKYVVLGKYSPALAVIKGNKKIEELDDDDQRLTAVIYMKMGEPANAASIIENLPGLSGSEFCSLAFLYETMGNPEKALSGYTRCFDSEDGHLLSTGLKIAGILGQMKHFSEADSIYQILQNEFSGQNSIVFLGRGTLNLQAGDTTKALEFFHCAISADSSNTDAMREIAQVAIARNKYDEALGYYRRLYETSDNGGRIYGKALALIYFYDEKFDSSETLLKSLLSSSIDDPELHFYLGLVYTARADTSGAEIEFEKAVSLNPVYQEAWKHLCYIHMKRKNTEKTISCAHRYTKQLPQSADSWKTLGYAFSAAGQYRQAVKAHQKSISLDSSSGTGWFDLGAAFERDSQFTEAAAAFKRALAGNPADHQAANYLGYMWAENGANLDSAAALLRIAISLDSSNGAYLDSYAWIFFKQNKLDSALHYSHKALAIISDDPTIYEHIGDIKKAMGDIAGALESYRLCIAHKPENLEAVEKKIREIENKNNKE
jgi:tetratricopeptide (TPR) repeat protein